MAKGCFGHWVGVGDYFFFFTFSSISFNPIFGIIFNIFNNNLSYRPATSCHNNKNVNFSLFYVIIKQKTIRVKQKAYHQKQSLHIIGIFKGFIFVSFQLSFWLYISICKFVLLIFAGGTAKKDLVTVLSSRLIDSRVSNREIKIIEIT